MFFFLKKYLDYYLFEKCYSVKNVFNSTWCFRVFLIFPIFQKLCFFLCSAVKIIISPTLYSTHTNLVPFYFVSWLIITMKRRIFSLISWFVLKKLRTYASLSFVPNSGWVTKYVMCHRNVWNALHSLILAIFLFNIIKW